MYVIVGVHKGVNSGLSNRKCRFMQSVALVNYTNGQCINFWFSQQRRQMNYHHQFRLNALWILAYLTRKSDFKMISSETCKITGMLASKNIYFDNDGRALLCNLEYRLGAQGWRDLMEACKEEVLLSTSRSITEEVSEEINPGLH